MRKWLTAAGSAAKLFAHLRTKLCAVNTRAFPLDSTGSVPAEVAFWKLLCTWKFPKGHNTKQNSRGRKIFPLRGIEELINLLLMVHKPLQEGAQSNTEPAIAAHSSAVPADHYFWFWYAKG